MKWCKFKATVEGIIQRVICIPVYLHFPTPCVDGLYSCIPAVYLFTCCIPAVYLYTIAGLYTSIMWSMYTCQYTTLSSLQIQFKFECCNTFLFFIIFFGVKFECFWSECGVARGVARGLSFFLKDPSEIGGAKPCKTPCTRVIHLWCKILTFT